MDVLQKKKKKGQSNEYRNPESIECGATPGKGFCSMSCVCNYTAESCGAAVRGAEPPTAATGLLEKTAKSDKRVSTFCNRKCDHRLHPATDAKLRKNTLGWKCHANSWVQPLNTSGVLSTPVGAFKGQGFVQSRLCRFSPRQCE